MSYSVGQVAAFAGITVRTLHHYDEIGMLTPGERTRAGYRRYTDRDLDRLQQILFYRELGFPLDEIAAILDDPSTDPMTHLRRQHELLRGRVGRLREMMAALEKAMEAQQMGISLTPEERFEVFGDFRPEEYEAEAEQRWGGSDAYRESRRRTARYTKADWQRIQAESGEILTGFATALAAGLPADGPEATTWAERHRQHLSHWFYDCSPEMHQSLGEMYVADPRFTAFYENVAEGLSVYVRDAITANTARTR